MHFEHHAYVAHGGRDEAQLLRARFIDGRIIDAHSPDLFVSHVDTFGVTEARALRDRALLHPLEHERNVFIVSAGTVSVDAQNMLLKTLEEPVRSQFFFFVPQPERLLPTLLSRVQILNAPRNVYADVSEFMRAPHAKRLDMIKEMVGEDSFTTSSALSFLDALEVYLATRSAQQNGMRALYDAKRYLTQTGASVKILLEHVALLV